MVQRKKPYRVGIPSTKMPSSDLSVCETLLALDKLVERYVRNHKGHPKLKPAPPFLGVMLASGKQIRGLFRQATEQSVAMFPEEDVGEVWFSSGPEQLRMISYETPLVVKMESIDVIKFSFPSREVAPSELTS